MKLGLGHTYAKLMTTPMDGQRVCEESCLPVGTWKEFINAHLPHHHGGAMQLATH